MKTRKTTSAPKVGSSALVRPDVVISIAADAMRRKVRDARVIAVDDRLLDFEETHKLGKQLGFGGYINLVEWLVRKYGAPYEGPVDWPNGLDQARAGRKTQTEELIYNCARHGWSAHQTPCPECKAGDAPRRCYVHNWAATTPCPECQAGR